MGSSKTYHAGDKYADYPRIPGRAGSLSRDTSTTLSPNLATSSSTVAAGATTIILITTESVWRCVRACNISCGIYNFPDRYVDISMLRITWDSNKDWGGVYVYSGGENCFVD